MAHPFQIQDPYGARRSSAPPRFPAPKESGQDRAKARKQLSILAVDDEPMLLKTYIRTLSRAGHSCQTAESGKDALEKYPSVKPDIVLSDFHMPSMNGLELVRELKKIDPAVKMVIVSGEITAKQGDECLDEGVKMVLYKPVDLRLLVGTIERFGF